MLWYNPPFKKLRIITYFFMREVFGFSFCWCGSDLRLLSIIVPELSPTTMGPIVSFLFSPNAALWQFSYILCCVPFLSLRDNKF